ncbi:MAG: cytochrome b/b6 domain-containing protein [Chloroflexi bacterium]|nr:cytochrome b/b6 domain-containing protein [Chloroflexota bacterium]
MSTPKKYNPWLVAIHWISALLIIFNLLAGLFLLKWLPNDSAKLMPLAGHMTSGIIILVLTLVRIYVRATTPKPTPASAGNAILDKIGVITHYLLYLGALGMGLSGVALAMQSSLFASVFSGAGSLPQDFYVYPSRMGHGFISIALGLLVLLHIGAALYHQFILRDGLLGRMSFRKD